MTVKRWVILLRGVNVGTANRIPMAAWRASLERLGYGEVRTLLASGNALLTAAGAATSHAARIRQALADEFGSDVPVVVLAREEFAEVLADNALAPRVTDPSRLVVACGGSGAQRRAVAAALAPLVAPAEALHEGRRALYLWCPRGLLASAAASELLGRRWRETVTTRNGATLARIAAGLGLASPA